MHLLRCLPAETRAPPVLVPPHPPEVDGRKNSALNVLDPEAVRTAAGVAGGRAPVPGVLVVPVLSAAAAGFTCPITERRSPAIAPPEGAIPATAGDIWNAAFVQEPATATFAADLVCDKPDKNTEQQL